jgi:hypothetical protein
MAQRADATLSKQAEAGPEDLGLGSAAPRKSACLANARQESC